MQMIRILTLGAALALPTVAGAATIGLPGGPTTEVASAGAGPLQCVLTALRAQGYPVRFIGGYRKRGSVRGSLHPAGMALDVNQIGRGRTTPRMPSNEISIATSCGAISGASWRNNDSGHFQVGGWAGRGHAGRVLVAQADPMGLGEFNWNFFGWNQSAERGGQPHARHWRHRRR